MAKKTGGNEKDEGVLEVVQSLLVTDEEETNSVFNVQKLNKFALQSKQSSQQTKINHNDK
jgi:hypothetical protein